MFKLMIPILLLSFVAISFIYFLFTKNTNPVLIKIGKFLLWILIIIVFSSIAFFYEPKNYYFGIVTHIFIALITGLLFNKEFNQKDINISIPILITTFAILSVIWITFCIHDFKLEKAVYQFDINHDLVFSMDEQTPEWQKLWDHYIGDGGRNVFTFCFGPIYSLLLAVVISLMLKGIRILKDKNSKPER